MNLDREQLLRNLRLPGYQAEEPGWFKYARLGLLPLVIALGSAAITVVISDRQLESARLIAHEQIESTKLIEESEQQNTRLVTEAELKTRRLEQIISIFSDVISIGSGPEKTIDDDSLRQKVASLEAYRDEALPFLLQLRHFKVSTGGEFECSNAQGDVACSIREAARDSIARVLGESQLDLTGQSFQAYGSEPLNLRHRKYIGYNLSESQFWNVNLYHSDFSESTLIETWFVSADLVRASFKGANLKNSVFWESDLQETNFQGAYLKGTNFFNCTNVSKARFSLKALLKADEQPFSGMSHDDYLALLARYREQLRDIYAEDPGDLRKAITKLDLNHFDELEQALEDPGATGDQDLAQSQDLGGEGAEMAMQDLRLP